MNFQENRADFQTFRRASVPACPLKSHPETDYLFSSMFVSVLTEPFGIE